MKKLLVYVNKLTNKITGEQFLSYRVANMNGDGFVSVVWCKEAKECKPLQTCYVNVEEVNMWYGIDQKGYACLFIRKVEKFEPYIKEKVATK